MYAAYQSVAQTRLGRCGSNARLNGLEIQCHPGHHLSVAFRSPVTSAQLAPASVERKIFALWLSPFVTSRWFGSRGSIAAPQLPSLSLLGVMSVHLPAANFMTPSPEVTRRVPSGPMTP